MEWKDLAPWIAIALTLALSILVPLFTQIANNRHQRKMQREKYEYVEQQKRINAFEEFLSDVGDTVVFRTKLNLEKVGSSIFRIYIYAPAEWLDDLDKLSDLIRESEIEAASVLVQKMARLIADELNKRDTRKRKSAKENRKGRL